MERKNVPDFDMHKKKCQNSILEARHSARCERAATVLFALVAYLLVIYKMLRPAAKKKPQNIAMSKRIELKRTRIEDSDDDMT